MSFKIEQGLFKFDFTDHHAIVGVPVDASPYEIRQRYKQVARLLHPDSSQSEGTVDKELAEQMLSKLVNPAYAQLSKERNRMEQMVMLGHLSRRLLREEASLNLHSEVALQLAQTSNLEKDYKSALQVLANNQYKDFDKTLDTIAQISELNLVYLLGKEKKGEVIKQAVTHGSSSISSVTENVANQSVVKENKPVEQPASPADPYIHRAQDYIGNNNIAKAILELRDGLNLDQNNSTCHSLLGIAYLKQHQATMAKVHINKALQLNPKDPIGLEGKQILDKLAARAAASKTTTQHQSAQSKPTDNKPPEESGGGLFGGFFGGKKK